MPDNNRVKLVGCVIVNCSKTVWVSKIKTAADMIGNENKLREKQFGALVKLLTATFLVTILLTPVLWIDERALPTVPVFNLYPLCWELNLALISLTVLSLILLFFKPGNKIYFTALLVSQLSLMLFDQARWMPYFIQFLVMIGIVVFALNKDEKFQQTALASLKLIIFSIYFWAGIQKFNYTFLVKVFPWFVSPITQWLPESFLDAFHFTAFLVPLLEVSFALMLLHDRTKAWAVLGFTGMHAFILICLGPLGHNWNSSVWPWNVVMVAMVWILFKSPLKLFSKENLIGSKFLYSAILFFFLAMPTLNFFGLWDDYLSHSLYSNNVPSAILKVSESEKGKLPPTFLKRDKEGGLIISFIRLSMDELNVPLYPAERVYKSVGRQICKRFNLSEKSGYLLLSRPSRISGKSDSELFNCPESR